MVDLIPRTVTTSLWAGLAVLWVFVSCSAGADMRPTPPPGPRPVTVAEWTPEAKLALGVCLWAEVGVYPRRRGEHAAIAWVLAKRSRRVGVPFVDMVRQYCSVHRVGPGERAWLLELQLNGERPASWPERASWGRRGRWWVATLDWLELWAEGRIYDPCPRATYWRGPDHVDRPATGEAQVCRGIGHRNVFYRVVRDRGGGGR